MIAICLFACATVPRYLEEIRGIQKTWAKRAYERGVQVFFFLGEEPVENLDDGAGAKYVFLQGVKNDYESASHKQNLGIQYLFSGAVTPIPDFVFCCGTDTFIFIDNLINTLANFSPEKPLYFGGHGDYRTINNQPLYFHAGGPGFVLSRSMVQLLEARISLNKLFDEWSVVCVQNGQKAVHDFTGACDLAISYYIHDLGTEARAGIKQCNYFYDNWLETNGVIDTAIGCHNVQPDNWTFIQERTTTTQEA
jgi:hypothetical protein